MSWRSGTCSFLGGLSSSKRKQTSARGSRRQEHKRTRGTSFVARRRSASYHPLPELKIFQDDRASSRHAAQHSAFGARSGRGLLAAQLVNSSTPPTSPTCDAEVLRLLRQPWEMRGDGIRGSSRCQGLGEESARREGSCRGLWAKVWGDSSAAKVCGDCSANAGSVSGCAEENAELFFGQQAVWAELTSAEGAGPGALRAAHEEPYPRSRLPRTACTDDSSLPTHGGLERVRLASSANACLGPPPPSQDQSFLA